MTFLLKYLKLHGPVLLQLCSLLLYSAPRGGHKWPRWFDHCSNTLAFL